MNTLKNIHYLCEVIFQGHLRILTYWREIEVPERVTNKKKEEEGREREKKEREGRKKERKGRKRKKEKKQEWRCKMRKEKRLE